MNSAAPIPRVNGGLLRSFVGRRVRLVCRVADLASGAVEASDGIQVLVRFQTGQPQTTYVEVIGIVESDGSIREEMTVSFGETFHLQNYDQVIQLSQQFPVPFSQ